MTCAVGSFMVLMTKSNKWMTGGKILLAVLFGAGVLLLCLLLRDVKPIMPDEEKKATEKSRVIARRALPAFTLLSGSDLQTLEGIVDAVDGPPPTVEELQGRYLLVKVARSKEITREMAASAKATPLITSALTDAVAVAIPANGPNSLGGSLQTGDIIDLLVVPAGNNSSSSGATSQAKGTKKFENLLVLNVPKGDAKTADKEVPLGAVTLALPREKLKEFASALASATLVVTHKLPTDH
jgi:Flp pilus assembly protein CpaB